MLKLNYCNYYAFDAFAILYCYRHANKAHCCCCLVNLLEKKAIRFEISPSVKGKKVKHLSTILNKFKRLPGVEWK